MEWEEQSAVSSLCDINDGYALEGRKDEDVLSCLVLSVVSLLS